MRERELRIALVCFGGVSLAVYMHGVSREILKLVRASKALHEVSGHVARLESSYSKAPAAEHDASDTEDVYYELLRDVGRSVDLRVVVDIIAGASAGGINGTMLARALSHDLPTGQLTNLWLDKSDISELISPRARPSRWSKFILRPAIWSLGAFGRHELARDAQARAKLSMFLRSRWFEPPLDGARMAAFMYDAVTSMGEPKDERASLMPPGQQLDLFVSLTDFYGRQEPINIHDPPVIHDREHRHVLHFTYRHAVGGPAKSDFTLDHAPALAFAARATSSFPGAFPPVQLLEIDRLLRERELSWPGRGEFLARHFEGYADLNIDAASVPFIDGGVLSNRPFHEAIRAIHGRPAYRQIDRRLVYVDPDPAVAGGGLRPGKPGFFATLKAALSDIPRAEPITEELAWVASYNQQVQRLRDLIDGARPQISQFVDAIIGGEFGPVTAQRLQAWRLQANTNAVRDAGFAYATYVGLKLGSVRAFISRLIADLRGVRPESPFARAITAVIDAWATETAHVYANEDRSGAALAETEQVQPTRWQRFLTDFDLDFRKRRLYLLIEGQNRAYATADEAQIQARHVPAISAFKRTLYDHLDRLRQRESPAFYSPAIRETVARVFQMSPSPGQMNDLHGHARRYAQDHGAEINDLLSLLAKEMNLSSETHALDSALEKRQGEYPGSMTALLADHVGFPYWDVLTFPVMTWREGGEFNCIRVDRISPQDAATFQGFAAGTTLKGLSVAHFAGLFSRGYRENDYLLGRLHAMERLIDIVADAAEPVGDPSGASAITALKQRGFLRILDAESPHLPESAALIDELRRWLASRPLAD